MGLDDIQRVAEIHVFAQRMVYNGIVSDKLLFAETTVAGRAEEFAKLISKHGCHGFVYDDGGIIRGFLIVFPCTDTKKANTLEIDRIFADPLMRGQRIGSKLESFCQSFAADKGYDEVCLWVLEGNHLAIKFYEKMGYTFDGSKKITMNGEATSVRYSKRLK